MPFDSDVALLGTGVAPLVAASRLVSEGKSVLILNPEWDFFNEDSELPFDPMRPLGGTTLSVNRLQRSSPERVLEELRPDFPGAVEIWPSTGEGGYHDLLAPHVRCRSRLWLDSGGESPSWASLEDLYVSGADAGMAPLLLEGMSALKRFPGVSSRVHENDGYRGVLFPKICDVDVTRYRNGLLEFIRERVGKDRVVCAASQIDLIPGGIRFRAGGSVQTALLSDGLLVFWTPRLTQWVLAQAKKAEVIPSRPAGVRLWEEWSLLSRESLDPAVVGVIRNLAVWAEVEGGPPDDTRYLDRLAVLRPGPLLTEEVMGAAARSDWSATWASSDSFEELNRLCYGILKWDKITIRAMKKRALFEWGAGAASKARPSWTLTPESSSYRAEVICGCDGPIAEVVRSARRAAGLLLSSGGLG